MTAHSNSAPSANPLGGPHVIHYYTFDSTVDRDAGTDSLKGSVAFVAADIGRVARIGTAEPYAFYVLTGVTVLSWALQDAGGGGAVTSVFGRNGVVVATIGDYTAAQVTGAVQVAGQLGGSAAVPDVRGIRTTTGPTLLTIGAIADGEYLQRSGATIISGVPAGGAVTSVHSRTGAVIAVAGDYTATQVTFTPSGDIAATNAQAAIEEVRTDTDVKLTGKLGTVHQGVGGAVHADAIALGASGFFTGTEKDKLNNVAVNADVSPVTSVHSRTGAVIAVAGDYIASQVTGAVQVAGQIGGSAASPDVRGIRTTTGPTLLTIGAILDGQTLVRSGSTIVGAAAGAAPVDSVHGRTGVVVAVLGDYLANQIPMSAIAPETGTVQMRMDVEGTVGFSGGAAVTDNGDGTVAVSASNLCIRATDSDDAEMWITAASAVASLSLTVSALNWIYVEYNAGAPQVVATTTQRTDENTNAVIATVYREGTVAHITDRRVPVGGTPLKASRRWVETMGATRASGSAISETGTRNFAVTSGNFWLGLTEFSTAAFDSSTADTYSAYYRDGGGGWTEQTAQSAVNNTQYDDGSGTLASLTGTRVGVHWVYCATDGLMLAIFGRDNYTSAGAASAGPPSDEPPHFAEHHAFLVGKITVVRNASALDTVESAFTQVFSSSAATSHSDLSDLLVDVHAQYSLADGSRGVALDGTMRIQSTGDITKQGAFDASGITPGQTRTITIPDNDAEIAQARNIRESGATVMPMGAVADGESLTRSAGSVVGVSKANSSRLVSAGTGLTGGGDLAADRTFNVVAHVDGSIVANANDIQVGVINATQHGNLAGGALHADAIALGASGFFTGTEKDKLNNITAGADVSPVTSVLGRTGVVIAVSGDYTVAQVTGAVAVAGQIGGTAAVPDVRGIRTTTGPTLLTIGAIADGQTLIRSGATIIGAAAGGAPVDSVFGRTGVVVAVSGDYTAAQVTGAVQVAGQIGGTAAVPDVRGIRTTTGPTLLTIGAVADGDYLTRSGATIIGGTPGGSGPTVQSVSVAGPTTISADADVIVLCNCASALIGLTCNSTSPTAGDRVSIIDTSGEAHMQRVTVTRGGTQLINGETTIVLDMPYGRINMFFDGTDWVADHVLNWDKARVIDYDEHFAGTPTAAGTMTTPRYQAQSSGSGSGVFSSASIAAHPGIAQLGTGSSATGRASMATYGITSGLGIRLDDGPSFVDAILRLSVLSTVSEEYKLIVGFCDQPYDNNPNPGAFFEYDRPVDTDWRAKNADTGETVTDSATAVVAHASDYVRLRVAVNADGTVIKYLINGTVVATHSATANIPAGVQSVMVGMFKSAGTTERLCFVDRIHYHKLIT